MKTASEFTVERVRAHVRQRTSPIRGLTPASLATALDGFDRGELRAAALLWDAIERRDDRVGSVAPKRKKALGRHGWTVNLLDESARAEAHKEAVEYFLRHVVVRDAIRQDYCRGWGGLVRTMLDAVGKHYAAHEIVWKPTSDGLTADLIFAPLWFFESRTGRLQFLEHDSAYDGVPLEPGGWMITAESGLMDATSILYLFKNLPLRDWLVYCEKFGIPPVVGKTDAPVGSDDWEALKDAVANFMNDMAAVMKTGSEITFPSVTGGGGGQNMPFEPLVDRCDRAISAIWRGGDLSTMSAVASEAGQGASVQDDESDALERDDAETIVETLNKQLLPWIVRYAQGDDQPLVEVSIPIPDPMDAESERQTDKLFVELGLPQARADLYDRYGRRAPEEDEDDLIGEKAQQDPPDPPDPTDPPDPDEDPAADPEDDPDDDEDPRELPNADHVILPGEPQDLRVVDRPPLARFVPGHTTWEDLGVQPAKDRPKLLTRLATLFRRTRDLPNESAPTAGELDHFRAAARRLLDAARQEDLAPLAERLQQIANTEDAALLRARLAALRDDLPGFVEGSHAQSSAFAAILGTSYLNGLATDPTETP